MELAPYVLGEHGRTLEDLIALLSRAHYRILTEDGAELPMTTAAIERTIPDGAGINIIAVPSHSSKN